MIGVYVKTFLFNLYSDFSPDILLDVPKGLCWTFKSFLDFSGKPSKLANTDYRQSPSWHEHKVSTIQYTAAPANGIKVMVMC